MWIYSDNPAVVKLLLIIAAVALSFYFAPRRNRLARSFKKKLTWLSLRPWRCAAAIFFASVGLSAALTLLQYPQAKVHDEFSYLLASDTFANGRMSNPTHPMWEHFESFHILSQPSYMAKYPPGNGLFMALGQKTTGHPIVGIWIALALAAVASYWAMRAWINPWWAMTGGFLVALNGPLVKAWGHSYWGGAVAMLAGALIFGGLRRIWRSDHDQRQQFLNACLIACGLVIAANSRPLEGFLLSIPVIISIIIWLWRSADSSWLNKIVSVIVPLIVIGSTGLWWMAQYNKAVTGDPLVMPYSLHEQTYGASSMLIWKQPREIPYYNHARMRTFFVDWGRERQLRLQEPIAYLKNLCINYQLLYQFFPLGVGLAFLFLPALWKDRWSRFAMLSVAVLIAVHSQFSSSCLLPHYLAPAAILIFILNIQCLRRLRVWHRTTGWGPMLVRAVVVVALLKMLPVLYEKAIAPGGSFRRQVVTKLDLEDGKDLVIVSYSPDYNIHAEWVYNTSDIDGSDVVWARDLGQEKNLQLMKHFHDRNIWNLKLSPDECMIKRLPAIK